MFGVLAAPGGIELNAKEMALAYGIGALIFWAVVSYFSGAGALGAFVAFGTLVYCWLWIPNRTTNFLNDVPGVTSGMIDGSKQYTLNGVVPLLGVISLVYAIQLIVRGVQRRRRERVDAERLQREQEAVQAQQEADVAAVYPVAGGTYQAPPPPYESHTSYDDLFDEPEPEPEPVKPRNQADEQTALFPVGGADQTAQFPEPGAESNKPSDETVIAQTPVAEPEEQKQEPEQQPEPVQQQPKAGADQVDEPAAAPPEAGAGPVGEPAAPAPVQEKPVEKESVGGVKGEQPAPAEKSEQQAPGEKSERVGPPEKVGAQYRERMEDPEDTGEFHLAFENPVVRPA
ncbi:hypothetical protein GCM10009804_44220 [Kribbella hippodromi]|uniref:Uncharacterized protein n=1 Tax=Kribbella hippodromi TaxID=434347 RepID=A0ABN2DTB5_9ACTN